MIVKRKREQKNKKNGNGTVKNYPSGNLIRLRRKEKEKIVLLACPVCCNHLLNRPFINALKLAESNRR
jgi:hypothetical protein